MKIVVLIALELFRAALRLHLRKAQGSQDHVASVQPTTCSCTKRETDLHGAAASKPATASMTLHRLTPATCNTADGLAQHWAACQQGRSRGHHEQGPAKQGLLLIAEATAPHNGNAAEPGRVVVALQMG